MTRANMSGQGINTISTGKGSSHIPSNKYKIKSPVKTTKSKQVVGPFNLRDGESRYKGKGYKPAYNLQDDSLGGRTGGRSLMGGRF